jgi:speckle-type POZ protein
MLHFIYTDCMPVIDEYDKTVMCQHLLVVADKYNLQRLKMICEDMLRGSVDVSLWRLRTLVLAEKHGCQGLKDACLKFLKSPGNIKAVMATDGFQP